MVFETCIYCCLSLYVDLHCAGGLVGPMLLGYVLDHSCLLWEENCDGSTGSCLYYDNYQMAWLFFAVYESCKALNVVCGLLCWRLYEYKRRKGKPHQSTVEHTPAAVEAGNDATGNNSEPSGDIIVE